MVEEKSKELHLAITRESKSVYKAARNSIDEKVRNIDFDDRYASQYWAECIEWDMKSVEERVWVTIEETRKTVIKELLDTEEDIINKTKQWIKMLREETQNNTVNMVSEMVEKFKKEQEDNRIEVFSQAI